MKRRDQYMNSPSSKTGERKWEHVHFLLAVKYYAAENTQLGDAYFNRERDVELAWGAVFKKERSYLRVWCHMFRS